MNVSPYAPTERDVVAKAQAYGDLNYGQYHDTIHAVAQDDTGLEHAPAEAEMLPEEQGGSKAEGDTVISQVRIEQRVDGNGKRR